MAQTTSERHAAEYTKTFWHNRVTKQDREENYPTIYHIYLHGNGLNTGSITDDKAPRTLAEAEAIVTALVESPDTEWTYGIIYEVKAVARHGTSYKRKKGAR